MNDRAALKALWEAIKGVYNSVVITEDMCVYDTTIDSDYYGTYTVTLPEIYTDEILTRNLQVLISGTFKDMFGNTHQLETLALQYDDSNHKYTGSWTESDKNYIMNLIPISDTEGRISIVLIQE